MTEDQLNSKFGNRTSEETGIQVVSDGPGEIDEGELRQARAGSVVRNIDGSVLQALEARPR